jgi:outer membrane biosynthesis protein TonB
MRIYFVISVVIHAALMLWLVLGPGAQALDPASAQPILVDLVPPPDAPPKPTKSEESKSDDSKPEPAKPEPAKAEPAKAEPAKTEPAKTGLAANRKPAPTSAEERAATAARLAWMLGLATGTSASLAGPPSESKSNLASEEIAAFKAQVSKCWVAPAGMPNTPEANVLIRIALNPDGRLGAAPELIQAPVEIDGRPLVSSAKRALQKCQPYAGLPVDKYREWKILDMIFTAEGPAGLSAPPAN